MSAFGRAACDLFNAAATLSWRFPDKLDFLCGRLSSQARRKIVRHGLNFGAVWGPMGAISVLACAATSLQKYVRGWIARSAWRKMRYHFAKPILCDSADKIADVELYEDVRHVPGIARIAFDNVGYIGLYRALRANQLCRGK